MDILATLGPACADANTLVRMFDAGLTGLRLNLSHTGLHESETWLETMHRAADRVGVKPKLIVDMQGPELRVGKLTDTVDLIPGERVLLGAEGIPVPAAVLKHIAVGDTLLMDDGKLKLQVESVSERSCSCRVIIGGVLRSHKSIAVVGKSILQPVLTAHDRKNIALFRRYGVTGLMQPFVRSGAELVAVREALLQAGVGETAIYAKIEEEVGVSNVTELLPLCDELVIARGDLGNAVGLEHLPAVQKHLARICTEREKPFLVATQLLASMVDAPYPTRAEVSDIYNAVLDGADSLLLTNETAAGRYPVEAVTWLNRMAAAARS